MFFSSNNAKKWQEELEILRNNNAKLTTALQESHANVEEWKRQLQFYRDECTRLRQLVNRKSYLKFYVVLNFTFLKEVFSNAKDSHAYLDPFHI
jgi:hypothetical protein